MAIHRALRGRSASPGIQRIESQDDKHKAPGVETVNVQGGTPLESKAANVQGGTPLESKAVNVQGGTPLESKAVNVQGGTPLESKAVEPAPR